MHSSRLNWPSLAPCAAEIIPEHHNNLDCQTLAAVVRQDHWRTDLYDQVDVVWLNLPSEITAFPQDLPLPPRGLQWDLSRTDNFRTRGSGPHIMGFFCHAIWGRLNGGKGELRLHALTGVENWLQSKNCQIILNGILSKREVAYGIPQGLALGLHSF